MQGALNDIQVGIERPRISFAEQRELADDINKPFGALIDDLLQVGPGKVSPKVLAVNDRVAGLLAANDNYLARIKAGTATEADRLNHFLNLKAAVIGRAATIGATSEGARVTGASGKIPIKAALSADQRLVSDAMDALLKQRPGDYDQIATQIAALANQPKKLLALLREAGEQPTFWNKFFEYYRANVLWNLATHVVNVSSGVTQVGLYASRELLKNPRNVKYAPDLAAGYGKAAVGLLPERAQQWLSSHMGVFDDLPRELLNSTASDKYGGVLHPRGAIGGKIGTGVRIPYKALEIEDLFQTKPIFNFALKIHAEKAGKAKGLKGQQLKDFVNNLPEEAFNDIAGAAMKDAQEFALHSSGSAAQAILAFREANPLLKAQILFVNTPINLAKLGTRFSPLGGLRALPAAIPGKAGASARARLGDIAAETVIGSAASAGFLALMAGDNMTGLRPRSESERVQWEAEGRQPMSIRASEYPLLSPLFKVIYGDRADKTWVTVNYLGPLLYSGLIAGAFAEATQDGAELTAEHAAEAAANAGNTMLNTLPMFMQYNGLKNLLSNPSAETVQQFATNLLKPAIPAVTLLQMVSRMTDGLKRDPKTADEVFKSVIPGLSQSVRPDYDVLGRVIETPTGLPGALPRATFENPSPVLDEADKLRKDNPNFVGLNKPSRFIGTGANKIALDPDTYNLYEKFAGQAKETALTELINSPRYWGMTIAEKSKEFERVEEVAQAAGLRAVGINIAGNSDDIDRVVLGLRLATRSGSNYEKAKSLDALAERLTPSVQAMLDSYRDQPDPTKDNYDLSVEELMHGKELVDAYRNAPAFIIGTPEVWAAAYRAAQQLKELRKGKTADEISRDPHIRTLYMTGAGGWLKTLFEADGSRKSKYTHNTRKLVVQDRLWSRFASAVQDIP